MFCEDIERYSLQYLEDELGTKEKTLFVSHLGKCKKCRMMFDIINSNYHPKIEIRDESMQISGKVIALLDPDRYPTRKTGTLKLPVRRIVLIAVLFTVFIFATANAKNIYKTYKELTNSMFVDKALLNITGIKHSGKYSDEEFVKSIYDGYEDAVNSHIDNMKTAEISRIEYDVEGRIFRIQIAKGVKGNFISYGFDGYSTYKNDFGNEYTMRLYENIFQSYEEFQSIDELKKVAGICPVPGYIPNEFELTRAAIRYINQNSKILDRTELIYQRNEGETLFVILSRDKLVVDNVGVPDELIQAAGLNRVKSADTANKDDEKDHNNTDIPDDITETLDINGYQTVYLEQHIKNLKENEGINTIDTLNKLNTFKSVNIFLGDNAKLPILRIGSSYLKKDELIKIAENITIENLPQNQIKADEYFKGIDDEKILAVTDEYLKNIRAGKTEFKINVKGDIEFYKWSHNDVYYIVYRNVDVLKVGSYIKLPFDLDSEFLKKFDHVDVQIIGRPYVKDKRYWCGFINNKSAVFYISINKPILMNGDLSLTDLLIESFSMGQNEVKPLYDKNENLYYLIDTGKTWMINTMYQINDLAYSYQFSIDKSLMEEEGDVMDFINNKISITVEQFK